MSESLNWSIEAGQLRLVGELEHETLLPLWQQRENLISQVETVELSGLQRVDTGGLALLVHLHQLAALQGKSVRFSGMNEKLRTLIELYNLEKIMAIEAAAAVSSDKRLADGTH